MLECAKKLVKSWRDQGFDHTQKKKALTQKDEKDPQLDPRVLCADFGKADCNTNELLIPCIRVVAMFRYISLRDEKSLYVAALLFLSACTLLPGAASFSPAALSLRSIGSSRLPSSLTCSRSLRSRGIRMNGEESGKQQKVIFVCRKANQYSRLHFHVPLTPPGQTFLIQGCCASL
jgi:hypothetical protein